MSIAKWPFVVAALAICSGCDGMSGPISTQPLYSDDTLAAELSLDGTWNLVRTYDRFFGSSTPSHAESIAFTKKSPGVYDFTHTDRGGRIVGIAHVVRLGRRHFLDLEVREFGGDLQVLSNYWPIAERLHLFLYVGVKNDILGVLNFDPHWLAEAVENNSLPTREIAALRCKIWALDLPTAMLQELMHRHSEEFYDAMTAERLYQRQTAGKSASAPTH